MYNLASTWNYIAGDLKQTESVEAARCAFQTVTDLNLAIADYRRRPNLDKELSRYLENMAGFTAIQGAMYEFRQAWVEGGSESAETLNQIVDNFRNHFNSRVVQVDSYRNYTMACLLALAAELTEDATKRTQWLDESLLHLDRFYNLSESSTDWPLFDPSLRSLRHYRSRELEELVNSKSRQDAEPETGTAWSHLWARVVSLMPWREDPPAEPTDAAPVA